MRFQAETHVSVQGPLGADTSLAKLLATLRCLILLLLLLRLRLPEFHSYGPYIFVTQDDMDNMKAVMESWIWMGPMCSNPTTLLYLPCFCLVADIS